MNDQVDQSGKFYSRTWQHNGGIIRRYTGGHQAEINRTPKRIRKTLPSLVMAKTWIDQQQAELASKGNQALALTDRQRLDAAEALALLAGASLLDAAKFYVRHHRPMGGVKTIRELLEDFVRAKETANLRPRSLEQIKSCLGNLAQEMGDQQVHTITGRDLAAWLDERAYRGVTRRNYIVYFTTFFNFAIKQGLIERNPAADLERPRSDQRMPEILTVGEVERLLRAAESRHPGSIPAFAIGLFAGLRSSELAQMDWSDIDFDSRLIRVRPEIAKRRRQRLVEMSDNLVAWLVPHRQASGPVSPPDITLRRWKEDILKAAGIARWPQNAMRHSFASYHLARHQDISRTSLALGHTSPDLLFNHYRNLVKPADSIEYWEMGPSAKDNILRLSALRPA